MADTIAEIRPRPRGTYGCCRARAARLTDCEMNVNHKLVNSIMSELGLYGLQGFGREIQPDRCRHPLWT